MEEAHSVYHFYQKMICLRKSPEYGKTLTYGDFEGIETEKDALIGYKRTDEKYEISVWVNFGNETVDLPEKLEQNSILLNNRTEAPESKLLPYQTILAVKEK